MKIMKTLLSSLMPLFMIVYLLTSVHMNAMNVDSIAIPANTSDILMDDINPYVGFEVNDVSIWNGKHPFRLYSLATGEEVWRRSVGMGAVISFTPHGVLISAGDTRLYDYGSGKETGKCKTEMRWMDSGRDILIGKSGNGKIECYRISTGERLWSSDAAGIDYSGWKGVICPDPEHIVFSANVGARINITTGDIQTVALKRNIHDNKGNALKIGLGVITGIVTGGIGMGVTMVPNLSKYEQLGSDILYDGEGRYYVADRDALICLDDMWRQVWRTELPYNSGSYSRLYLRGDSIDILNEGVGVLEGCMKKVGYPFWATYDRNTGKEIGVSIVRDRWDEEELGKDYLTFVPDGLYRFDEVEHRFVEIFHDSERYPVMKKNLEITMADRDLRYGDTWDTDVVFRVMNMDEDGIVFGRFIGYPKFIRMDLEGKVTEIYPEGVENIIFTGQGEYLVGGGWLRKK